METVTSTPTVKQRRKFERIETANMNNHDTSSVNHVCEVYAIGKLSKREHEEAQTLADCCKASIKNGVLQEKNVSKEEFSDKNIRMFRMNKFLLFGTTANHLVIMTVGLFVTYSICKKKNCADARFPYISDTAIDYPESSIFCLTLTGVTVSGALSMYLRHLLTLQFLRDHCQEAIDEMKILARVGFWCGIMTILSIQIVGTFQAYNVREFNMHFVGVIGFFVFVLLYTFFQNMFTYHMIGIVTDRRIYHLRVTITAIMVVTSFAALIPGIISWYQFKGKDIRSWQPDDGGWTWHVISVIAEWIHVILADFYIVSFVYEFRTMHVEAPVVKLTYLTTQEKTDLKTRDL